MTKTTVARVQEGDLKRAKDILAKIEEAAVKQREARHLLDEAAEMASNDSYAGVKNYDQNDIRDVAAVIRIAVGRPINMLIPRWIDIVSGREQAYKIG